MTASLVHVSERTPSVAIDQAAILRALNLNPSDPKTQALLLVCQRYELDPLMKHMVLISGNPYITRDGYLHVAHRSGQFDGMEVVDCGENDHEWWAKVSVWRKDMGRPFTYIGRYPKSGSQKRYGPEMAIKVAEVMALRRAFSVTGVGAADEQWDAHTADDAPAVEVVEERPAVVEAVAEAPKPVRAGRSCATCGGDLTNVPVRKTAAGYVHGGDGCPEDSPGSTASPAGDPQRADVASITTEAGAGEPPESSPAPAPLSNRQKAMHAKVGDMVADGVWPKADADMLRKGVISAITDGKTDSSRDLDDDAMSDVLDALDAIWDGQMALKRRATGAWSIDPVRRAPASSDGPF